MPSTIFAGNYNATLGVEDLAPPLGINSHKDAD